MILLNSDNRFSFLAGRSFIHYVVPMRRHVDPIGGFRGRIETISGFGFVSWICHRSEDLDFGKDWFFGYFSNASRSSVCERLISQSGTRCMQS